MKKDWKVTKALEWIKSSEMIKLYRTTKIHNRIETYGGIRWYSRWNHYIPLPKPLKVQGPPENLRPINPAYYIEENFGHLYAWVSIKKRSEQEYIFHKVHITQKEAPLSMYKLSNYLQRKPSYQLWNHFTNVRHE